MQGAGGIGGLLAVTFGFGGVASHYYYHSDGNGNVTYLADKNQAMAANYRYDAFGTTISSGGSEVAANIFRFSSREQFSYSGVYVYLYRLYDPNLQRWLNRDPMASTLGLRQRGRNIPAEAPFGPNLYTFVYNNPQTYVDPNGLWGIAFGNDSGSSYFNFGFGNPSLYFSPDSANGVAQSAAATADGLNPFGNPFANHGAYDPNDPLNKFSHGAGKVAQVCLTSAAGLGALKAANAAFLPQTLYHFTSVEGAAAITASGGIDASAGLYGYGTYLTGFNSAAMAAIQGASATEVAIPIATEGLEVSATYFPGTYIVRGAGVLLP